MVPLVLLGLFFHPAAAGAAVKRQVRAHRSQAGQIIQPWDGKSVQDLHREYSTIFKHGNRNAASHLWSTFLIERARFMSDRRFQKLNGGYCAVSGSPVSPSDPTRYRLTLEKVDGTGKHTGFMYYCCWPCVCDTQDFIRIDTKTIELADGPREYHFAVIGNPCSKPGALSEPFTQPFDKRLTTIAHAAPEVRCGRGGVLEGATMSDNGYVIVALFFDASRRVSGFQDEADFKEMCENRKDHGYNSGMGEIFRRVAAIAPVDTGSWLLPPAKMTAKQLRAAAARLDLNVRGLTEKAELVALVAQVRAERLQNMTVKQLRAEAARLDLDLRGISERPELLDVLAKALGATAPTGTLYAKGIPSVDNGPAPLNLTMMRTRELQKEARRRGLDTQGIVDRSELVALLKGQSRDAGIADAAKQCSTIVGAAGEINRCTE